MDDDVRKNFLRKRIAKLRTDNHMSQTDMAAALSYNKSTISRIENVDFNMSYDTILEAAKFYCGAVGLSERQTELFLRGDRVVVVDTCALIRNPQLIDELTSEYSIVVIPQIVFEELENIKKRNTKGKGRTALNVIKSINNNKKIVLKSYEKNTDDNKSNDAKIVSIAAKCVYDYNTEVDVISADSGVGSRLKNDDIEGVNFLSLTSYNSAKQNFSDMDYLKKIYDHYADDYSDIESKLGIKIPDKTAIDSYYSDKGFTCIIEAVRDRGKPFKQRKNKIKWLIEHGADVDRRDCHKYYFPALTHAVQVKDFEMFKFLLHECYANPNQGSRNLYYVGKVQEKNEGNTPLMVAAWHGKVEFLKELCNDERISLNQQDANGFTAYIKAAHNGHRDCMDILEKAGADTRIVDRDGHDAEYHWDVWLMSDRNVKG